VQVQTQVRRAPSGPAWLNRNVLAIGLADCMADFNYEMVLAVLPLFLTAGLGAPASAVGLVEGVADGSSAAVRVWSGWFSDRVPWRKRLAVGGYSATVAGLATLGLIFSWPLVVVARGFAWVGRGLRQPVRSSMLAGSVGRADLGKAFGFHEAMDTLGALLGPAVAFALLARGQGFRTVFWVAILPGLLAVSCFALLTRDPRPAPAPGPQPRWAPLPAGFWRLLVAVAVFGVGNFAPAFFTLRAAEMLQPELPHAAAVSAAVLFYLGHHAVGTAVSFPGGWVADRLGKVPVLAFAYLVFGAACLVAMVGHGPSAVALLALAAGLQAPLVTATEGSLVGSLVPEQSSGTAFGVLAGVNGVADLLSSVSVGLLWTAAGAPAGLAFGGLLAVLGGALLLVLRPGSGEAGSTGGAKREASAAAG
jgi:MFS family permease